MSFVCANWGEENHRLPTQEKSITATTSQQIIVPDEGYSLSKLTANPQQHSESYTPAANTSSNDMGAVHNKRYVNTSGMIRPSGNYNAGTYTTNGNKTINGISSYASVSFDINVDASLPKVLLWKNDDLEASFAESAFNVTNKSYDYMAFQFISSAFDVIRDRYLLTCVLNKEDDATSEYGKGNGAVYTVVGMDTSLKPTVIAIRKFSMGYSASLMGNVFFSDCFKFKSSTKMNAYCIPYRIYGVGNEYS